MIVFKIDIIEALEKKGYTTYQLTKKPCFLGAQNYHNIKHGKMPGLKTIDIICSLLKCQPGSILKYIPDNETTENEKD